MIEYLEMHKQMHDQGHFDGHSLITHIDPINKIILDMSIKTGLDYGCGKAEFHPKNWNFDKYDPCFEPFSKKPNKIYDLVICTDVMEHIPENEIDKIIDDLYNYTQKILYCSICIRPAHKILPNGKNAHATIKPKIWWENKFSTVFKNKEYILVFNS